MGSQLGIGGYATCNGVTIINSGLGKVVRAYRDSKGNIAVKELTSLKVLFKIFSSKAGYTLLKIPILGEIPKAILMLSISIISLFLEIVSSLRHAELDKLRNFITDTRKYHGAEHKVINMAENSNNISYETVDDVRAYSRIHNRCGTNMAAILIPFILCFYIIEEFFFSAVIIDDSIEILVSAILLIFGMNILKQAQKPRFRKLLIPGFFMQKYITTREPGDEEIEVALAALKGALDL